VVHSPFGVSPSEPQEPVSGDVFEPRKGLVFELDEWASVVLAAKRPPADPGELERLANPFAPSRRLIELMGPQDAAVGQPGMIAFASDDDFVRLKLSL
jgi:hypothetical protein